ncbi:hypothetical protein SCD_n00975 [Sulfuricella denitrificans skB26]|uniref:Uncharacterized protein n=1 Tax=Sulfuricella denitrificans (strain DSM 22764 / NBRC 105220 / skB26) TaxID=1163617 RepID=S6A9W4_SULDS|nr:hypothetical protein SCD_n00975 [Sulfuricella denitrificans skB26]
MQRSLTAFELFPANLALGSCQQEFSQRNADLGALMLVTERQDATEAEHDKNEDDYDKNGKDDHG